VTHLRVILSGQPINIPKMTEDNEPLVKIMRRVLSKTPRMLRELDRPSRSKEDDEFKKRLRRTLEKHKRVLEKILQRPH